jgi:ABC-type dipeptide/oligopeptide/nickel transport system ATPase component
MINFYDKLPKDIKQETKLDKDFKNHHILPNSMIAIIGGTGSGKSNALCNLISKQSNKYYDIIIFNPVSTDEPLLKLLKQKMPELKLISEIEELPSLSEFVGDSEHEKLIVFDDVINMSSKDFKKVKEYFTGGRKLGFTVVIMAQNYVSIPKTIVRNCQYFIIFKLNDNVTINNIIKNHNIYNVEKEHFKKLYQDATKEQLNFFLVDLKTKDIRQHLRHNFIDFFDI